MKKAPFFCFLSFVLSFVLPSCSDNDDEEKILNININITEFVLNEGCSWKPREVSGFLDLIRSQNEMNSRIVKTDGAIVDYPDFSQNSILLTSGSTTNGVDKIKTQLIKNTETQYTFLVDVYTNLTAVAQGYQIAVLTPALDNNVTVSMKTVIH